MSTKYYGMLTAGAAPGRPGDVWSPGPKSGLPWFWAARGGGIDCATGLAGRPLDVVTGYGKHGNDAGTWADVEQQANNGQWPDLVAAGLDLARYGFNFNAFPWSPSPANPAPGQTAASTWADAASGAFDDHWIAAAVDMRNRLPPGMIVRVMWMFNLTGKENHYAGGLTASADVLAFNTTFARIVNILRTDYDPDCVVHWAPHYDGDQPGNIMDFYPGDSYVDLVGPSWFDRNPSIVTPSNPGGGADWATALTQYRADGSPKGLAAWLTTAKAHGKKFGLEWGLITGAGGGGDNADLVGLIFDWLTTNQPDLAYEFYSGLDVAANGLCGGSLPNAAAIYTAKWGVSAPSNVYALGPDWTKNYAVHRTAAGNVISQLPAAVRLDVPPFDAAGADGGGEALWAFREVQKGFDMSGTFVNRGGAGTQQFAQIFVLIEGEGSTAFPVDVTKWAGASASPTEPNYAAHSRGLRISMSTQNLDSPDLDDGARVRWFNMDGTSPQQAPNYTGFAFPPDVSVQWTLSRRGGTITFSAYDGVTKKDAVWTNSAWAAWTDGYVGFKTQGRDSEFGNITVVDGIGDVITPTAGYWKTPNIQGKGEKVANDRSELTSLVSQFKNNTLSPHDWYVRIATALSGNAITIDAGGDASDPLVFMMDGAGTDTGWGSRPVISCPLVTTAPYVWLYGLRTDWASVAGHEHGNNIIRPQAAWQFVTCCYAIGNGFVTADNHDGDLQNIFINYNRVETRWGGTEADYMVMIAFIAQNNPFVQTAHGSVARNYAVDGAGTSSDQKIRGDFLYMGEGTDSHPDTSLPDMLFEYNYLKASVQRGIYAKYSPTIRWNDMGPVTQPFGNTYGGCDTPIGYRGTSPGHGLIAYNRIRGGNQLMCQGPGHVILSNAIEKAVTQISMACHAGGTGKPTLPADCARIIGNYSGTRGSGTANIRLPWYLGNADDPDGKLGDYYAESKPEPGAPSGKNVVIAGPDQACHEDVGRNALGPQIGFDANGHPLKVSGKNGYLWRNPAQIWKTNTIPAEYELQTPPQLSTTLCGPAASGDDKTWGS
jgi:hypothetical protein